MILHVGARNDLSTLPPRSLVWARWEHQTFLQRDRDFKPKVMWEGPALYNTTFEISNIAENIKTISKAIERMRKRKP